MTRKKNPELTKGEAIKLAWMNRKEYKGYDRTKGSMFNTWRGIINTNRGRKVGFPKEWLDNIFLEKFTIFASE